MASGLCTEEHKVVRISPNEASKNRPGHFGRVLEDDRLQVVVGLFADRMIVRL